VANATDQVRKASVRRSDEIIRRPLPAQAAAITFWPMSMVGLTAAGYVTKFDDSAKLDFVGLSHPAEGKAVIPICNAGDYSLEYAQPWRFELAVSGVAITDIGRLVYALDDQTGTLSASATTYSNVVGVVVDKVATGVALVEPIYPPRPPAVQILSADGAVTIKNGVVFLSKAGTGAYTIAAPTTGVDDGKRLEIITTTAQAHVLTSGTKGFNAKGSSGTATWTAAIGNSLVLVAYAGDWYALVKTGVTIA
jgi:hypothetical protein